jgi:Fungal cellulose binding domain
MFKIIFHFLLVLVATQSHTWVACTDVAVSEPQAPPRGPAETDPVRRQYDDTKCGGYARNWSKFASPIFGTDLGADSIAGPLCREKRGEYTDRYNMATYVAGSTVCAQYPSKTHVAASTTNLFIPDTSLKIFRTKTAGEEPTNIADMVELNHYNDVHVKGVIDYKGFGACPAFDSNPDKSVCTVCFDVGDVPAGEYTFVFYWIFNENTPPYTNCWDATIATSEGALPVKPVKPAVTPTVTPAVTPTVAPAVTPTVAAVTDTTQRTNATDSQCFCPCTSKEQCIATYKQCGGKGYQGATNCCSVNDTCQKADDYYSQCRPQ